MDIEVSLSDHISCKKDIVFDVILKVEDYPLFLKYINSVSIVERNNLYIVSDVTVKTIIGLFITYRSYTKVVSPLQLIETNSYNIKKIINTLHAEWHIFNGVNNSKTYIKFIMWCTLYKKSKFLKGYLQQMFMQEAEYTLNAFKDRCNPYHCNT